MFVLIQVASIQTCRIEACLPSFPATGNIGTRLQGKGRQFPGRENSKIQSSDLEFLTFRWVHKRRFQNDQLSISSGFARHLTLVNRSLSCSLSRAICSEGVSRVADDHGIIDEQRLLSDVLGPSLKDGFAALAVIDAYKCWMNVDFGFLRRRQRSESMMRSRRLPHGATSPKAPLPPYAEKRAGRIQGQRREDERE